MLTEADGERAINYHRITAYRPRAGSGLDVGLLNPVHAMVKFVAAAASWSQGLTRNTNAPKNDAQDAPRMVEMERVFQSNANHLPDEDIHFLLTAPDAI